MDIRQLRYFIAIVEEKKISAAAERIHISQPPLSQHLKTMEEELGVKLVERSGKSLEVTEAGKALYKYALQMTQLMEEAKMEVKEVGDGINGRLTVGINTFSVAELSEILHQFKKQYPKVTYKIQQNESSHLCKLVRDRVIELAIIRLPLELDDFSVLHLHTEPFYLITSQKQKPADHEVSLAEIENVPLLLPSTEGLGVHYLILEAFSRFKLHPHIIGECSDISLLMDLVSSDFGASIVPETLLKRHRAYPIHAYKISSATKLAGSVGVIWLKNHYLSKAAQNFINLFTI
ncbi:LysR family transcriptional regulator [Priestia filamentosa]|uniref:LysR family transcriptional regulator n=1 Tax=Priestia filamentosa TaxID=1402861 RepID=A0A1X7DYH3_9BACI|nr:LysR family transcriptional regulator [Priestia filamentosa]AKO92195.1 LysR family transcriptional regulator [Priestia filamentosa]MDT3762217.1 LysR family transcriptional regulator [Priestia filamentosa]OXS68789.1 LysR family transcriptional regulator [Priestia filamentosa]RJS64509.1 LysR family transcriptional regulator [Priestia filamentosa]WCM17301.1 LysR family transcriptional regulator [Priestia filamentosa]